VKLSGKTKLCGLIEWKKDKTQRDNILSERKTKLSAIIEWKKDVTQRENLSGKIDETQREN